MTLVALSASCGAGGGRIGPVLDTVREPVDARDRLAARELLDHAAVIQSAGLTSRQLEMISFQARGLTHEQIAARTGDSRRTVERQILRARAKLTDALRTTGE